MHGGEGQLSAAMALGVVYLGKLCPASTAGVTPHAAHMAACTVWSEELECGGVSRCNGVHVRRRMCAKHVSTAVVKTVVMVVTP